MSEPFHAPQQQSFPGPLRLGRTNGFPKSGRAACVFVFVWFLAGAHAGAALLAYEPFDYSVGEPIVSQENGLRVHSMVEPVVGKTAFIVVMMEFREGSDRFTLFVNPTPGKPEPGDGVVKEDLHLELANKLFLYSRGAWSVDEIRLGTSWQDVTPVAEVRSK